MDYDSPEVMKDFPGLYSAEKRKGNDSDYNDDNEKATKKEMLIGKRKEKRDKKDRDKGYAALEGESSDEASTSKAKKSKAFKFSKSKEKEKEQAKDKAECSSKSRSKKKSKHQKFPRGFGNRFAADASSQALAETLPIFGADIASACQRGKCHDGICIPLPVRECIDYVEANGLYFENVYKISGPKNKVHQIRKMYNNRQPVKLKDYDVPTVTSVLKTFLRDLSEPIIPNDLLVRFEEAGAILNYNTRSKHMTSLINSLPVVNRKLLTYTVMHLHNVAQREQVNKMGKQNLAQALHHVFRISSRLLQALITHRVCFYPEIEIVTYYPPMTAESPYPDDPDDIMVELCKLESALNLIHWEMQQGFFSDERQDQLWEVQRIQTDLKRKLKKELSQPQPTIVSDCDDQNMDSHAAEEEDEEESAIEYNNAEGEDTRANEQSQQQGQCQPESAVGSSYQDEVRYGQEGSTPHDQMSVITVKSDDSDIDSDECEVNMDGTNGPGCQKSTGNQGFDGRFANQPAGSSGFQEIPCRYPVIIDPNYEIVAGNVILRAPGHKPPPNLQKEPVPCLAPLQPVYQEDQYGPMDDASESEYFQPRNEYSTQEGACSALCRQDSDESMSVPENEVQRASEDEDSDLDDTQCLQDLLHYDSKLYSLQAKNDILMELIENLSANIQQEKNEITEYKKKVDALCAYKKNTIRKCPRNFEEVRRLLIRENHMLEIKKVQLVRQIMEYREQCVDLKAMKRFVEGKRSDK